MQVEKRIRKDFESGSVEDAFVDGEFVVVSAAADLDELYYPYIAMTLFIPSLCSTWPFV